jgi:hypothetical protein
MMQAKSEIYVDASCINLANLYILMSLMCQGVELIQDDATVP